MNAEFTINEKDLKQIVVARMLMAHGLKKTGKPMEPSPAELLKANLTVEFKGAAGCRFSFDTPEEAP